MSRIHWCVGQVFWAILLGASSIGFAQVDENLLPDDVPDYVTASMEVRNKWFASLPQGNAPGLEFFVDDLQKWNAGQTIKVAFLGGDTTLHKDIADAVSQIEGACNIKLDFGFNAATGKYRAWTTSDAAYAADIRVSFDQAGYFSLVGRDSVNPSIGGFGQPVGGKPNQRSLNLGGFHIARPATWKKTTRHEFLHALSFKHEHQSPLGGCDSQFRWDDDAGYVFTQDANGQFITDPSGKRPGIYTYLSGAPNNWSRSKVDHNLRQAPSGSGTAGTFDRESIMLYRFPSLFYVSRSSSCSPLGSGEDLSAGDRTGLKLLYPSALAEMQEIATRRDKLNKAIQASESISSEMKAVNAWQ